MGPVSAVPWIWPAMFGSGSMIGGRGIIIRISQVIIPKVLIQVRTALHAGARGGRKAGGSVHPPVKG